MKSKVITGLKKYILVIELPENTKFDVIADNSLWKDGVKFLTVKDEDFNFIEGNYTLLGKPDEIKEDDVKDLVETKQYGSHPFFCTLDYSYEGNTGFRPGFCADDGKQFRRSFNSALESEIYWLNPLGEKPKFEYDFPEDGPSNFMYESAVDDFDISSIKWKEAQEKTFDRNRTLIFVKN
ncbi:MAG: hypothetical protein LC112_11145 [Flavobacteriales bacterium]|nr:hypothetical protein [Flavobacteriales bacterium]